SRFYLLNGWNGLISHPPVFSSLLKRTDLDAFLIEVAVTETASMLASRLGPERVLLIRPGSDSLLALSVGHQLLKEHSEALDQSFLDRWACDESLQKYRSLAESEPFSPKRIALKIAAEPRYVDRLHKGIETIAARLANPEIVPINLPSVGLSQTRGAVAHCLWGNCFALVGKYGLKAPGEPAGGVIRIPGQINAQSEIQGLSHKFFMGRIPCSEEGADDVCLRMDLPRGAYDTALADDSRAALDYSDPADRPELFLCFGTQFESNMMNRERWVKKLKDPNVTLVVVDPIPDPFTEQHAELIIPSPPHAAAAKLYQNGEWRLTLSVPHKKASPDTRTDATIVYDVMALISKRLRESLESDSELMKDHNDLAPLVQSGYLQSRFEDTIFGGQLSRVEGEVSRGQLWSRVLDYFADGEGRMGAVYCRPEHESGAAITWAELVEQGSVVYGGVGTTRYLLNSEDPEHFPFADKFRNARKFQFFTPTSRDIELPTGILLNSGRSTLSDNMPRIRFAISTFNSGKATPILGLPEDNPVYVSIALGAKLGLKTGGFARVRNPELDTSLVFRVVVTERVKGDSVYINFHKTKAEMTEGQYLNKLTSHKGRCPYTAQSNFKLTVVELEAFEKNGEE
ncbi:MAG: molybdopterin dinucleotide binding domain-containing protein, partial [Planctomycetota bacterium]|nr:molybdopterin dinucleotide binding domain-containing protein [Planctomycetota bacterium]